ncbi:MAG: putative nucleic acid-binding protein, contains PIN domain protein [Halonotius sp. J07HN4]|nr:MAG: putative nucleic acid-binding protein, contains PIN domain protein [Halonotius sp. J07HN4]
MKLLDTSAVIDIDRGGVDDKVATLDDQGRHLLSMVTVTELRLGVELQHDAGTDAYQEAQDKLTRLLARFDIHPISRPIATTAAQIIGSLTQQGQPLNDLHDVYIAATARTQELPVVTANVDDFERIDDVEVIDWETF